VYADFSGTVGDGEISLRSEPPLSEDEILTLLLFGTPEGRSAGTGSEAATALSVAGESATRGLNQLLARFTELDLQARIDTSTGSARPELVWELTPRLTARLTRALGEPPPGQSPDRTFLTLELRLRQRWSISTIVGDRGGTGIEVLWRVRF
jgi:autotransporter translocation and assembly factor TamB